MSDPNSTDVTRLLSAINGGHTKAADELLPLVYDSLRRMAGAHMSHEPPGHTLQPTALVHEAYLRLVGASDMKWHGRGHFFAAAATAMRRILVERARRKMATKHGGGRKAVPIDEGSLAAEPDAVDMLALDEALDRLALRDERWTQIVMLRYFAGLSIEDTAAAMGLSMTTVKDEWNFARAWLHRELRGEQHGSRA